MKRTGERCIKSMSACTLTALLIVGAAPNAAKAETFVFKDSAQDAVETAKIIKQPQNKQKIFGRLESKDDVDYFTFAVEADENISISLLVPAADKDFTPSLIVFGPDLPKPEHDPVITVGEGNGSYVLEFSQKNIQTSFNDFLLTFFKQGPFLEFSSPKKSSYGLAVRSPDGNTGRYVLTVGQKDKWSWDDVLERFFGAMRAMFRMY